MRTREGNPERASRLDLPRRRQLAGVGLQWGRIEASRRLQARPPGRPTHEMALLAQATAQGPNAYANPRRQELETRRKRSNREKCPPDKINAET